MRVEHRSLPRHPLDVCQTHVVVIEQRGLLRLDPVEQLPQALRGVEPDPDGQSVDEQSDHRLDARYLRGTPGDRGTERHVVPRRQLAQHDRPRRLDHGVDGDSAGAHERGEGRGLFLGQAAAHVPRFGVFAAGIDRRHQRRPVGAVECASPLAE